MRIENNSYKSNIRLTAIRFFIGVVFVSLIISCEPWNETAVVSHVSQFPQFELNGEEFQSYLVVDSAEYTDPGAEAYSNGEELNVSSYGEVDLTEVGVYTIVYYAENSDGIWATAERIIAVTNADVSNNDLSGNYEGTIWSPLVEMKVTRIHPDGYYKAEEIMGFPGAEVKGRFVDLGDHELYLIHDEGDFGRYSASQGEYTLTTLSWTIKLLDSPYEGVEVSVFWKRIN